MYLHNRLWSAVLISVLMAVGQFEALRRCWAGRPPRNRATLTGTAHARECWILINPINEVLVCSSGASESDLPCSE